MLKIRDLIFGKIVDSDNVVVKDEIGNKLFNGKWYQDGMTDLYNEFVSRYIRDDNKFIIEVNRHPKMNYWMEDNELVIVHALKGTYRVLEKYEDDETVFMGNFEECLDYCNKRIDEYELSFY